MAKRTYSGIRPRLDIAEAKAIVEAIAMMTSVHRSERTFTLYNALLRAGGKINAALDIAQAPEVPADVGHTCSSGPPLPRLGC